MITNNSSKSIIEQIKTNDVKFSDFDDVGNVLRNIGIFDDYFLPVFNGTRPIEMETIEGQDMDVQDSFLEFTLKAAIEGTGVPSGIIGNIEEIEGG